MLPKCTSANGLATAAVHTCQTGSAQTPKPSKPSQHELLDTPLSTCCYHLSLVTLCCDKYLLHLKTLSAALGCSSSCCPWLGLQHNNTSSMLLPNNPSLHNKGSAWDCVPSCSDPTSACQLQKKFHSTSSAAPKRDQETVCTLIDTTGHSARPRTAIKVPNPISLVSCNHLQHDRHGSDT